MRGRLRAAVVVTALGLAACSGSSGSSSSSGASGGSTASVAGSEEQFCSTARAIVSTLGGNVFTDPRGIARIADRIEALTPPPAIARQWPAFLTYVRQVSAIAPRDPDAASSALDVLGSASTDVSEVGAYLVDTCRIDAAASDLSDFSDLAPRS